MRQLRDVNTQKSRANFRTNIEKIGQIIGYEISKTLDYNEEQIATPLAKMNQDVLADGVVVVTILRAGLPLHNGILEVFPEADNGFISLRIHKFRYSQNDFNNMVSAFAGGVVNN